MIYYPKENKFELNLEQEYTRFFKMQLDLLNYGEEKHKGNSFQQLVKKDDFIRTPRLTTASLALHSRNHFNEYYRNIPHDKFGNLEYQLAAASVNPMMEFVMMTKEKLKR